MASESSNLDRAPGVPTDITKFTSLYTLNIAAFFTKLVEEQYFCKDYRLTDHHSK